MRALITGCAGFIGSNMARRCIDEGWHVDAVDDMSNGHSEFIPKGLNFFFYSDFASEHVLSNVNSQKYDAVIHLAAIPRVSYSVEHPLETHETNVNSTLKLLEACKGNVGRIVFASSSSVYGGADVLPTPEAHARNPKSPYALQKAVIEDYLQLYNNLYGLDSACMRFFNVFGPNQLGGSPYATAVSAWLTAIKEGRPMRSDGDGSQTRDMCYVDNVVDACMRAASFKGRLNAECFNVACGDRTSNIDVLNELKRRYPDATHVDAPWRPGDVMHTQADVTKAGEVLGYKPLVKFWDGFEKTVTWYEENWGMIKGMKLRT